MLRGQSVLDPFREIWVGTPRSFSHAQRYDMATAKFDHDFDFSKDTAKAKIFEALEAMSDVDTCFLQVWLFLALAWLGGCS